MNLLNPYSSNSLFENFDRILSGLTGHGQTAERITETDEAFALSLDLPGVQKEHIDIQIENRTLTLKVDTKDDDQPFVSASRQTWKLPRNVDTTGISAALENGVFTLTLPKAEQDNATHTIAIS